MSEEKTKTDGLKLPTTITATYKIITPMFIGDAEQQATAISPQSFKGALRFWWRALAWGRIRQDALLDPKVQEKLDDKNLTEERREKAIDAAALTKLHHQEAVLFGSSATKPDSNDIYGKGCVAIKVTKQPEFTATTTDFNNTDSKYLAYGLLGDNNHAPRKAIPKNKEFSIQIIQSNVVPKNTKEEEKESIEKSKEELLDALKIMGLFGSLGGRSRRALGSIQLKEITYVDYPNKEDESFSYSNAQEYGKEANKLLKDHRAESVKLAPYTAVSKDTLFAYKSLSNSDDMESEHKKLSEIYQNYRKQNETIDRRILGLPINSNAGRAARNARRASPVFMHIFECGSGYGSSVLYLPSSIFHYNSDLDDVNDEWDIAKNFLDKLGGKK